MLHTECCNATLENNKNTICVHPIPQRYVLLEFVHILGNSPARFGIAPPTGFSSFIRKYQQPLLDATTSFIPAIDCSRKLDPHRFLLSRSTNPDEELLRDRAFPNILCMQTAS